MLPRLLIVEDQQAVARTLARALEVKGFVVSVAHSCADAEQHDGDFDCAVLDIDLPDGSGLDLCRTLRDANRIRCVVFFSGSADGAVMSEARGLGRFVAKSAGLHELVQSINESLAECPEREQRASQY